MKTKRTIEVTYQYEIEIDESNDIVQEYGDELDLVEHLATYRFSILPVLDKGVKILDVTMLEWEIMNP